MKGIGMKNFSGYTVVAALLATATLAGCPPREELHTQVLESASTINGKELYFIPSVSDDLKRLNDPFYTRIVSDAGVPTQHGEGGGQVIDFADGPFVLELDQPVMYYGVFRNSIVIASDGTIGFDGVGGGNDSLEDHFTSPQISVLPIIATAAGTVVTVSQDADFIVVDYANVVIGDTTKAVTSDNNFQVVFDLRRGTDGDIVITYSKVDSFASGIVGLSNGQLAGLSENDAAAFLRQFQSSNLAVSANTDTTR